MIEYWDLILVVIGAVAGWLLSKYGLSKYRVTLDVVMKALEDGKITKDEAIAIIDSFMEQYRK